MYSTSHDLQSPLGVAFAVLVVLLIIFTPAIRDHARKSRERLHKLRKREGDSHDDSEA
ncbi:hypothetical protein IT570_04005 [Candidatus Sumerlaeota bacterium]|nr:hypothetical protein [Candidatus Sumerlaeota bacterium]